VYKFDTHWNKSENNGLLTIEVYQANPDLWQTITSFAALGQSAIVIPS